MKFLHQGKASELSFVKVRARASGAEVRFVSMEFGLVLDGTNTRRMPDSIGEAWRAMRVTDSHIDEVRLEGKIESQNIEFHAHVEDNVRRLQLVSVNLEHLKLRKIPDGKIALYFQVTSSMNAPLWKWIGEHFGREMAATFEEGQMELNEGPAEPAEGKVN